MSKIIMWTEVRPEVRAKITKYLASAGQPVRDAARSVRWEGENLIFEGEAGSPAYRNLYTYFLGWGDAQDCFTNP